MSTTTLYSPALLALAIELADYPLTDGLTHRAELRSRTCGSTIELGLDKDTEGRISDIGLRATACAVGQAAAAIFADGARGRFVAGLAAAELDISAWLSGTAPRPAWPRLERLDPVLLHAGRHEAILLSWRAATSALSKVRDAG